LRHAATHAPHFDRTIAWAASPELATAAVPEVAVVAAGSSQQSSLHAQVASFCHDLFAERRLLNLCARIFPRASDAPHRTTEQRDDLLRQLHAHPLLDEIRELYSPDFDLLWHASIARAGTRAGSMAPSSSSAHPSAPAAAMGMPPRPMRCRSRAATASGDLSLRQTSINPCLCNKTFGRAPSKAIWVAAGCKGVFTDLSGTFYIDGASSASYSCAFEHGRHDCTPRDQGRRPQRLLS